ncbi:MAG: hypothetical protein R3B13_40715 [Polyangiaceae bacterium]
MNEPKRWLTDPDAPADAAELLRLARPTREMTRNEMARSARRLGLVTTAAATTVFSLKGTAIAGLIGAGAGLVLSVAATPLFHSEKSPRASTPPPAVVAQKAAVGAAPVAAAKQTLAAETAPTATYAPPLPPAEEADTLGRETALLDRARAALSGTPSTAIELLNEHARQFPKGKLGLERELLRVDALRRTNQRAAALTLAKQLQSRAGALYQPRLEQLIQELEPKRNMAPPVAHPTAAPRLPTAPTTMSPPQTPPVITNAPPATAVPKASFEPTPG